MRVTCVVSIAVLISLLTGCGTINSEFDCNAPIGVSCKPLSEIHEMVNSGILQKTRGVSASHQAVIETLPIAPQRDSKRIWTSKTPLRSGEQIQRIWIAPFEDKDGNYYAASFVYTVVKPAHWINTSS